MEHNRLTLSDTLLINESAVGYMEMMKYRNSARGHLIALEKKIAMKCYLDEMIKDTTMKQKADGTSVCSEMYRETVDQLASLPLRAVILLQFEEEMRNTPKVQALIVIPYIKTELQLRFAWCMT